MGERGMDQFSFAEICLHQLKMFGVHDGGNLVVLIQGNKRLDYADDVVAEGRRLAAKMSRTRPSAVSPTGAWAVSKTALPAMPEAVESLRTVGVLIGCIRTAVSIFRWGGALVPTLTMSSRVRSTATAVKRFSTPLSRIASRSRRRSHQHHSPLREWIAASAKARNR